MDVSLLIRLVDQFSGPAQKVRTSLENIGKGIHKAKGGFSDAIKQGFSIENVDKAVEEAGTKLSKARSRLLGAFGQALALGAPLRSLGNFEERMIAFGNVAGIYGDKLGQIEAEIRAMGPAVNRSANEMLTALEYLVGKGLNPDVAMNAIRSIGLTATATGAAVEDMAASGYAAIDNLKVPAEHLQLAFDAMAEAGKRGGFELNSMATYFPSLTASAQMLGMHGVDAIAELSSALQIARKGAGSDQEAANNMQNFLSKLTSPETVKRFAKQGVDIKEEFEKAAKSGVSIFEHMLGVIQKMTADDQFAIGELFGDMQVMNFLKPMMANLEEFREIREAALKSSGVNERDYARVMEGFNAQLKATVIQFENLIAQGSPLLDIAKELLGTIKDLASRFNAFATANPALTRQLMFAVTGMMALSIAGRVLAFGLAGLRMGLIPLLGFFLKFNKAGRNIATGWLLLRLAGRGLSSVFGLVGSSARIASAGFGGFASGARLAGREAIAARGKIGVLQAAMKGLLRVGMALSGGIYLAFEVINDLFRTPEERLENMQKNWERWNSFEKALENSGFGRMFQNAKDSVNDLLGLEHGIAPIDALTAWGKAQGQKFYDVGVSWVNAISDGLAASWGAVKDWFDQQIAALKALFTFDMKINWPEPPAWLNYLMELAGTGAKKVKDAITSDATTPYTPQPYGGGSLSSVLTNGNIVTLRDDQLRQTINAEIVDHRPPQQTFTNSFVIHGATDPKAVANTVSSTIGDIARSYTSRKSGALHGGTE